MTKFGLLFVLAVLALQNSNAAIELPEGVTSFSAKIQEIVTKHNTEPLLEELKKEVNNLLATNDKDERLCSSKAQDFIAALVKDTKTDVDVCVNRAEVVVKDLQDKMTLITEQATAFSQLLEEEVNKCTEQITKKVTTCAGCPIDVDLNLETLNALTNTALNHIESESNNKHVVLNVIRAQSQVVAGIKYTLLLEVAPTDCPKTVPQSESCELLTDDSQICEVSYVQRPWISKDANIISNNCTISQEFNAKPTPKKVSTCAGCPIDVDLNLETLNALTNTALNHIESESNNKHVVLNVIRAQSQVVAGIKYILLLEVGATDCPKTVPQLDSCELLTDDSQICEVSYYQRSWISKDANIISNNCTISQEFNAKPTPKKLSTCAGCPIDVDLNLETLNALTNTALNHIESESNNKHVVLNVIRAQSQVVAGIKYILLLEVGATDCPKTVPQLDSCELLTDDSQICEVSYYQRSWISKDANIISNNCTISQEFNAKPTPKKLSTCAGCPIDVDLNLETLNALTNTALNHIESESNNKHVVLNVIRAQSQVVAGIKYILLLEVGATDCPKTVTQPKLNSCGLLPGDSQICEVSYVQRPWISKDANIISNNCTISQEFNARNNQEKNKRRDLEDFVTCVRENTKDEREKLEELELQMIQMTYLTLEALKDLDICLAKTENKVTLESRAIVSGLNQCIKNVDMLYTRNTPAEEILNKHNVDVVITELKEEVEDLLALGERIERLCGPKAHDLVEALAKEVQNDGKQCLVRDSEQFDVCLAKVENKATIEGRAIVSGVNQCIQNVGMLYSRMWSEDISEIIYKHNVEALVEDLKKDVNKFLALNEKDERLCGPKTHQIIDKLFEDSLLDVDQCLATMSSPTALKELDDCMTKVENKVVLEGRAIISGLNQCISNTDLLFAKSLPDQINKIVAEHNLKSFFVEIKNVVEKILATSEKDERLCGPKAHKLVEDLEKDSQMEAQLCMSMAYHSLMPPHVAMNEVNLCLTRVEEKIVSEGKIIIEGLNKCIRNADMLY